MKMNCLGAEVALSANHSGTFMILLCAFLVGTPIGTSLLYQYRKTSLREHVDVSNKNMSNKSLKYHIS